MTIKYSKEGVRKWFTQYGGGTHDYRSFSICADDIGNAYIAGYRDGTPDYDKLIVMRLRSSNGAIDWIDSDRVQRVSTYDYTIAVDGSDGVYLATNGYSDASQSTDFWLIKWRRTDGQFCWQDYLDKDASETWRDMVLQDGNIFVAGTRQSGSTERVYTARYISNNSDPVWVQEYNISGTEGCDGIDLDNYGNVYVSGTSRNTSVQHPIILKYNVSGILQWDYHYSCASSCTNRDIKVHRPTGKSYIIGCTNNNILTIAVDASGDTIWTREYGGTNNDNGYELGVTTNCVYASGYTTTANSEDILTLCYARETGNMSWADTFNYAGYQDVSFNVAVKPTASYTYIVSAGYGTYSIQSQYQRGFATLMYRFLEYGQAPPYGNDAPFFYTQLYPIYPNPTKDVLKIRFNSPDEHEIKIKLYDATGRLVKDIFDGTARIGMNEISYEPKNLPNGIYFARLETANYQVTEKVIYQR